MSKSRAAPTIRDRIVELRRVPASSLVPNPKNWREHPKAQTDALREMLGKIGFAGAALAYEVDGELRLIDGHARQDIAGDQPVPVLVLDVSEDEADQLLATFDPLGAMASANAAALTRLASGMNFDSDGLRAALSEAAGADLWADTRATGADPDEVPPLPVDPITQPGDLWLLGPHRLLCGDATNPEHHERLLGDTKVDLVLTDPPYGVDIDYGESVDDSADAVRALVAAFMPLVLKHTRVLLTPGHRCMWDYPPPKWILAWVHPAGSGGNPWGFTCFNPILAYGPDPYLAAGLGRRADTLVLAADREGLSGHPVEKPLAVWRWVLERGTIAAGQSVFDPFMGSGTTLVAAQMSARVAHGIEIEPRWVDAALTRYQRLFGVVPVLESTGAAHDFTPELVSA